MDLKPIKYLIHSIIIIGLVIISSTSIAGVRAFLDYKTFYIPDDGPFFETILEFDGNSLYYVSAENELVSAEVQMTMIIKQGEEVIDFRKLNISSPLQSPESTKEDFMDMQRFSLPNGIYTLDLRLLDLNDEEGEALELEQNFEIDVKPNLPFISDITFIKAYNKADSITELSKSGYNILPYVNSYFPTDIKRLAFYVECYNADKEFGMGEKYVMTYFIANEESGEVVNDLQRYQRMNAEKASAVFQAFDIAKLPTGDYKLQVEMRNRDNKTIASRNLAFFRNNQIIDEEQAMDRLPELDVENTFVMAMTDRDTLMEHIESTWPILTNLERNAVQYTLQDADITIMRQFFYSIWERRNPNDPEGEWQEYAEEVKKVQAAFGTRVMKGYQTDRGRVYLQYGEPNTIVKRHNDLDAYPYEIWHYYKIGRFNNKRLIFYNPDLVTNDFQLLNSDIPGEVRNDQWVLMVLQRNNTFGNVDKNVVDNGASRVLIDLWNNPR